MAEKTEDLNLPLSVVSRIIKEALPEGTIVSKEARLGISRAASVFILHATTYANQAAAGHKRKTLTATDVLSGIQELQLNQFLPPLQEALSEWKAAQTRKAEAKKTKGSAASAEEEPGEEGTHSPSPPIDEDATLPPGSDEETS